jgi:hypothetical protein
MRKLRWKVLPRIISLRSFPDEGVLASLIAPWPCNQMWRDERGRGEIWARHSLSFWFGCFCGRPEYIPNTKTSPGDLQSSYPYCRLHKEILPLVFLSITL